MRLLPLLALGACISTTTHLYEITVDGEVQSSEDAPIGLSFQHAYAGVAPTDHPLGEIDDAWMTEPGAFSHTLAYPMDDGEGLVVYAWQDLDGDGLLCAPGAAPEPVGLVEVEGFPAHHMDAGELSFSDACRGPEAMFP